MKNSINLQKNYYNQSRAKKFDHNRINSNHLYKIEIIEQFYEESLNRGKLKVLEVGGGTGIHALHFMQKEKDTVELFICSDLSEDMLALAKEKMDIFGDKIEYLCCEAENFVLAEKIDCIYISGAMHHFPNPIRAIGNCKKYLKENGMLIICEPIVTNPYAFIRVLFKKEEYGQFNVTRKNVKRWLLEEGFTIQREKVLHYKSNHKIFRFVQKIEKIKMFDWLGVMFIVKAINTH